MARQAPTTPDTPDTRDDPAPSGESIWFRLGYALERTRSESPARRLAGLAERLPAARGGDDDAEEADGSATRGKLARSGRRREASASRNGSDPTREALDALIATGAGTLIGRMLGLWRPRGRPGLVRLARAGLAGAGAALLGEMLRPLVRGEGRLAALDDKAADAMLSGAARGLVFGAVVDPRLPGPPVARGAAFGAAEYWASPWGGLAGVLGREAPHRRVPLLEGLFEDLDREDDTLAQHVVFGVALAVLYGSQDLRRARDD